MADSLSPISESGAADGGDNNYEALLNDLLPLWQAHHAGGLELRHLTGKRLNDEYGTPDERQEYGKATLKKLSEALGVAESDLSRMRRFAQRFESVEALNAEYPDATTWTKVKELLARLRHPQSVPVDEASGDTKKSVAERPLDQMVGEVRTLRKYARNVGKLPLHGDDWKVLSAAVNGMLKDVGTCLGGRFKFALSATPGRASTAFVRKSMARRSRSMGIKNPPAEVLATVAGAASNGQSNPL